MKNKNSGLGRGLDHLFNVADNNANINSVQQNQNIETENNIIKVHVLDIKPNQHQPRKKFNDETLQELAQSIKNQGIVQPLIVRKTVNNEKEKYEIVAGERRYRAAKIAGVNEIPVIVREYNDIESMTIALIENLQREDLNVIDEAEALNQLKIVHNLSQDELAEKVGKSRSNVANILRLLGLPENIKRMVVNDEIKPGHARTLLCITNPQDQQFLCSSIIEHGLTVRDVEKALDYWKEHGSFPQELMSEETIEQSEENQIQKEKKPPFVLCEKMQSIDLKLKDLFHKKATIKGTENKGSIKINYKNKDELLYILSVLSIENNEID